MTTRRIPFESNPEVCPVQRHLSHPFFICFSLAFQPGPLRVRLSLACSRSDRRPAAGTQSWFNPFRRRIPGRIWPGSRGSWP
jgi:hypothetical protein